MLGKYFNLLKKFNFLKSSSEDIFLLLSERGKRKRSGEKETSVRERSTDWLPPARTRTEDHTHPDLKLNPQPRYVPWRKIKPTTFWLWEDAPTNRGIPAREKDFNFCYYKWYWVPKYVCVGGKTSKTNTEWDILIYKVKKNPYKLHKNN